MSRQAHANGIAASPPLVSLADGRKRIIPMRYRLFGQVLNFVSLLNTNWASRVLNDMWFTVFKKKPKPWVKRFWDSVDNIVELSLNEKTVPVGLWGKGPLVVMVHGWSGSGTQFRHLVPGLVAAGYQVAIFDAPAHGSNPGKTTHLLEFSATLNAVGKQIGPIDTIMAHSLGAMATLVAMADNGLKADKLVLFAPHLSVDKMHETYSETLGLNPKLSARFRDMIGARMSVLFDGDDPWARLTPANLLKNVTCEGLLIHDANDPEISPNLFGEVKNSWSTCQLLVTQNLGHRGILKDENVIETIVEFMSTSLERSAK